MCVNSKCAEVGLRVFLRFLVCGAVGGEFTCVVERCEEVCVLVFECMSMVFLAETLAGQRLWSCSHACVVRCFGGNTQAWGRGSS